MALGTDRLPVFPPQAESLAFPAAQARTATAMGDAVTTEDATLFVQLPHEICRVIKVALNSAAYLRLASCAKELFRLLTSDEAIRARRHDG